MSEEKKKSLFDKAIAALTDRDEKEAPAAQAKVTGNMSEAMDLVKLFMPN